MGANAHLAWAHLLLHDVQNCILPQFTSIKPLRMADEIAELKQLQADLNASFEAIYAAKDARALAQAKAKLVGQGHATARLAAGT